MKKYNELSNEEKNQIVNVYFNEKGLGFQEMSEKLGVSRRGISRVLRESNINTRLKNRYKIHNENYFECIDTEFKAYMLGFIFADGYVGLHNDFCIALACTDDNYNVLTMFKDEIGITLDIKRCENKNGNKYYVLKFSNEKIVNDLNKLGVRKDKLQNRNAFPKISSEMYSHFIRGLFDGDGSISQYVETYSQRKRCILQFMGTQFLMEQLQEILSEKCNIKTTKAYVFVK